MPSDQARPDRRRPGPRSEEHTSELQSLIRNSYAVFWLKKKKLKKQPFKTHSPIKTTSSTQHYLQSQDTIMQHYTPVRFKDFEPYHHSYNQLSSHIYADIYDQKAQHKL